MYDIYEINFTKKNWGPQKFPFKFTIYINSKKIILCFDDIEIATSIFKYWYGLKVNVSFDYSRLKSIDHSIYFVKNVNTSDILYNLNSNSVFINTDIDKCFTFYLVALRAILPRMFKRGIIFLHGCAFNFNKKPYIILGNSGSGKSHLINSIIDRKGFRFYFEDYGFIDFNRKLISPLGEKCIKLKNNEYNSINREGESRIVGSKEICEKKIFQGSIENLENLQLILLTEHFGVDVNKEHAYKEILKKRKVRYGNDRFFNESIPPIAIYSKMYRNLFRKLVNISSKIHCLDINYRNEIINKFLEIVDHE